MLGLTDWKHRILRTSVNPKWYNEIFGLEASDSLGIGPKGPPGQLL
jgi:hypothetical protein